MYTSIKEHQYISTKVYKYKSIKVHIMVICNIPICVNWWKTNRFYWLTAVGATAVGVKAVIIDLEFWTISNMETTIISDDPCWNKSNLFCSFKLVIDWERNSNLTLQSFGLLDKNINLSLKI